MKRAGGLWPSLVSLENLHRAAYQVLRGKRGQRQAGDFFYDLEGSLLGLQRTLAGHDYRPGPYRTFWISDPKPRLISAAPFADRVVHHALVNVIEPVFERRFVHHSYACRRGKGNHRALRRFTRWARSSRYVLKLDVKKFFPTIDHLMLKAAVRRAVKDPEVLWLCDRIVDSSNPQERVVQYFPGDDLLAPLERRIGIPIGNLTSQFLANVHLDPLDHFIKQRLGARRYLRYVDDLACFGDDKAELRRWRREISNRLLTLRLKLNERKSRLRRVKEGIEFLGFVVLPTRLRLSSRNVRRMRRRARRLVRVHGSGLVTWPEVRDSLAAWNAHAAHGDTEGLRRDVFRQAVF